MTRTLRLIQQTWLAEDVLELRFGAPGGEELPGWEPGAHITLTLSNGTARDYSLCGDPEDRTTWTVAVLRERQSRGGSAFVHDRLRVGELVDVDGPRNNFPLESAGGYLLIAGGIGITPIKAMAQRLDRRGADWSLFYCGRTRQAMAYLPELRELAGDRLTVHCDDEHAEAPDLDALLAARAANTQVYCCGPEPLLSSMEERLMEAGVLHLERFRAAPATPSDPDAESSFDVVCAGSDTRVSVEPGCSIVDALAGAGVDVMTSCREGICGTCETKVLEGEPDHRDSVLTPGEKQSGETMMLCVSRCRSAELTLDLF